MRINSVIFTTLSLLAASLFINSPVFAGDIEWSGLYRIEGYQIHNSELRSSNQKSLNYALSHLVLRPKIVAGDGLTIFGQFDIMNSSLYPNSQMGQIWGHSVNSGLYNSESTQSGTISADNSNVVSNRGQAETIQVSQLYLTYNMEFGQLLVGRAPLQFGLGMTHNAGRGLFDHWYETRDMVAYKFVFGGISVIPMLGKAASGSINHSDDLDDFMIQAEYENPESDLQLGVFYQIRHGGDQAADAPVGVGSGSGSVLGGQNATNSMQSCSNPGGCTTGVNTKTLNVYALRDTDRFRIGLEAAFMSGEAGILDTTASQDKVEWAGFGVAAEFEYRPLESKWKYGLKTGFASGDDPSTAGKYEGFSFNRNYDVAMLMFNHPLGQADFLRTGIQTGAVYDPTSATSTYGNINRTDVEAISNAIYFAPVAKYAFSDHWSLDNTVIAGWLSTSPLTNQQSNSLGYEWDIGLNFAPRKGVMWINQIGLLFPGKAWDGDGSSTYANGFAYGLGTKAAISF